MGPKLTLCWPSPAFQTPSINCPPPGALTHLGPETKTGFKLDQVHGHTVHDLRLTQLGFHVLKNPCELGDDL